MTSTVSTVVCNPLKPLVSTVASTVPPRFGARIQPIDVATSTVLHGPLRWNPHTPIALTGGIWGPPEGFRKEEGHEENPYSSRSDRGEWGREP